MNTMTFKVMLLGEIGVGKTSIARQLVFQTFEQKYKATLGVEIYAHHIKIDIPPVAMDVSLSLWDVDGDIGHGIFKNIYIAGADAALVLADITRPATRQSALGLTGMFTEHFPGRPVAMVLNKADLAMQAASEQLEATRRLHYEVTVTSAKTGDNVEASFARIAENCAATAHDADGG